MVSPLPPSDPGGLVPYSRDVQLDAGRMPARCWLDASRIRARCRPDAGWTEQPPLVDPSMKMAQKHAAALRERNRNPTDKSRPKTNIDCTLAPWLGRPSFIG